MRAEDTQDNTLGKLVRGPRWTEGEQLRIAFENMTSALAASCFAALTIVLLLWPVVESRGLILWLGASSLLTLLRIVLQQQFSAGRPRPATFARWKRAFVGSVFLAGCMWGALSALFFPTDSVMHQAYLALVLSGIAAGAVTAYAPLPGAFPAFVIPALSPFALQAFNTGAGQGHLTALLVAAFMLSLVRSARHSRGNVMNLLRTQMKNLELTRELHHRATHDSLVDLVNQGEFKRRLQRLAADDRRSGREYSIVFIDLDRFKEVNDGGGHAAGDRVLQAVAGVIQRNTRAGDTAARVGGDEFAAILDGCPHDRAAEIAETIRVEIEQLSVTHEGEHYSVRASIGVAYGRTGEHTATSMLQAADAACYAAKEGGRNRVRENKAGGHFSTTDRFELTHAI